MSSGSVTTSSIQSPGAGSERYRQAGHDQNAAEDREGRDRFAQQQRAQQRSHDRLDVEKDRGPRGRDARERPVPDDVTERGNDDGEIERAGDGRGSPGRPSS